jgi:beta-lactamase class A
MHDPAAERAAGKRTKGRNVKAFFEPRPPRRRRFPISPRLTRSHRAPGLLVGTTGTTGLLIAGVVLLAGAVLLAGPVPPALATDSGSTHGSAQSAGAASHVGGSHLPFMSVARADVEVLQGAAATLPYRIEGAHGGRATVRIVISVAGGAVVKTIVVGQAVRSGADSSTSFVCHLRAGTYVWTVRAVDALHRTPTVVRAAHLTVDAVYPAKADIDRAIAWLRQRSGVTAVAVVDTAGVLHGWHQDQPFVTASVIKAMLLVEYLRTHASVGSSALATLTPMIEVSDNNAAQAIYHVVGDGGLYALARAAGMTHFAIYGQLFGAQLTAADQARFFYRLPDLVPPSHRALALYLLSHVVSYQSWGIPAAARPRGWDVWFKGGWRGTSIGQLVHQVARLHKGALTFSMAVFTNGDPSQGYGIETIQGVAARILAGR